MSRATPLRENARGTTTVDAFGRTVFQGPGGPVRADVPRVARPAGDVRTGLDSPQSGALAARVVYGACALLLVASLGLWFFTHTFDHGHFAFEHFFAFYALWGFGSFVFLVVVAKQLRKLIERPEDYYGDARPIDEVEITSAEAPISHQPEDGRSKDGRSEEGRT